VIQLNDTETLDLDQVHNALQYSVRNGLKLAIFCSCNGLGLARKLADLKIPYVVVMREPVPDRVAQAFLQHFLTAFSQGNSIHDAVHQARMRLQDLRHQFPCAAWLPVICQNPAAPDLRYPKPPLPWFQIAAASGISAAALWFGGNYLYTESQFQARLSLGNKVLVITVQTREKSRGVQSFQEGDYAAAAGHFEKSLRHFPNDPESQIYLNNSRAMGRNPIKVGMSVPIGTNPNVAQEMLRGVAQQQTELNESGGIQGRPVQVQIANDDNKKDIAAGLAQRFVNDATIVAVIGHNASEASLAAAPVYRQGKLVMITPTSFSVLPTPGDYMFRMVPGIPLTAKMIVDRMTHSKNINNAQVAVCADRAADGGTYRKEFKDALEHSEVVQHANIHKVNIDCDFSAANSNPDEMVKKLIEKGVNTVLIVPHIDRIPQAIKFARAARGSKLALFGSPTFMTAQTAQLGKGDINGFEIAVPWYPNSADPSFLRQNHQRWGADVNPTWRTAMAYDTLKTISVGLRQSINPAQSLPIREGLQAALRDPNFKTTGASGPIQFESGDRILMESFGTLVQIQPVPGKPGSYDFMRSLSQPPSSIKIGNSAAPLAAPSPVRK
jgi:branched-chain amino acid transport system substrate-binding protein